MDADALLLPFPAALPKRRRLPPPVRVPLTRTETLDLFIRRHEAGFLISNPDDNFFPPEMCKHGFAGSDRACNGADDANPEFISMDDMAGYMAPAPIGGRMKRLAKIPDRTMVQFPDDWARLTFDAHQVAALAEDDERVAVTMRAAVRVRYIHDAFFKTKANPKPPRHGESGHDSFKEWCESIDRTERWGLYLVQAAAHAPRVENPRQARALSGLSSADADTVVAAAVGAGPVTAKTLSEARAETVRSNRAAAQEITEAMSVRKVKRSLEKAKLEMQKTTVFTDKHYASVDEIISVCAGQLDEAA